MHTTHLRKVGEAELRYGAVMLTASRRRETLIAEMGAGWSAVFFGFGQYVCL